MRVDAVGPGAYAFATPNEETRMLNRRRLLQAGSLAPVALSAGLAHSQAKPDKLTILSHRVHMSVITGTKGGNAIEDWSKRNGVGIDWVTLDTGPLHERLFREASLGSTSIDMAFLLNTRATPNAVRLLEPLDPLMKADPLEDPADLFPGLVAAMKFGGQQYAVPHRHATTGFHYNEAIFQERGVPIPKTFEDVIDAAKKLTFTRPDGSQVFGFLLEGDNYPNVIDMARAFDGDFLTLDYKLRINEGPDAACGADPARVLRRRRDAAQLDGHQGRGGRHLDADRPRRHDHQLLRPHPVLQRARQVEEPGPHQGHGHARGARDAGQVPRLRTGQDRILVHVFAQERPQQTPDLEPHQAPVLQGEHHQGRAQRQRPRARVELQGSAFCRQRPVCRGRGRHAQGGPRAHTRVRQRGTRRRRVRRGTAGRRARPQGCCPGDGRRGRAGSNPCCRDAGATSSLPVWRGWRWASFPTALETAPRLSAEPGFPPVWIKREDQSGLALGGNKPRQLEFLMAAAHGREAPRRW
jgi:hypothetical protein